MEIGSPLTILEGSVGGNYHLQFIDEEWQPYRAMLFPASYGEPCILTSWDLSSQQLNWQGLNPCANHVGFWESPGKPLLRQSGTGVGQPHNQSSQEWEITVTPLIWPELPVDKVEKSARHSNFLGLCSDNHSPSVPLKKTPVMKRSPLPVPLSSPCSLLSLPKPPSLSYCSLSLRLDSPHLSPFAAGQRSHLTRWRVLGKALAPKDLPLSRAHVPKRRGSLTSVYWLVKSLTTWWELSYHDVSLCIRSDVSSQQLC